MSKTWIGKMLEDIGKLAVLVHECFLFEIKWSESSLFFRLLEVACFFYYQSYIGLLIKWKRHNGGLVLENLKYIF